MSALTPRASEGFLQKSGKSQNYPAAQGSFDVDEQQGVGGLIAFLRREAGIGVQGGDGLLDTNDWRLRSFFVRWKVKGGIANFPEEVIAVDLLARVGFFYCPDSEHFDR